MCFTSRQPAVVQNVLPEPEPDPIIRNPEPPKQVTDEVRPLMSQTYQPGIQQAGSSQNRRRLQRRGTTIPRRRGLTTGIAMAGGGGTPSGGINL
ncbi:MAG: hypothetical protein VW879_04580 [Opitutae bacterium]